MGSEVSFGGYAGKSLAQKMRDKTDEMYREWMTSDISEEKATMLQGKIEGACEMMAILTTTTADLQWESTEARYDDAERMKARAEAKRRSEDAGKVSDSRTD